MISLVADSCFWLTRYLERVDTWARVLGVSSAFSLDAGLSGRERWRPLVIVNGQEEDFVERFGEEKLEDGEVVQSYLVWDARNPYSLHSAWRAVRENGRTIREVMSVEMWETINEVWLWLNSRSAKRLYERERDAFYEKLCSQCMLFHGVCHSTMLHEEPFTFMKLGRSVERIGQSARIMDLHHYSLRDEMVDEDSPEEAAQLLAILRSFSAYEPFFKRAGHVLSGPTVAEFILFDRTFPRSVLHNLDRVRLMLFHLRKDSPQVTSRSWELLERFRGSLLQLDMDDVMKLGLHETLEWVVDQDARLCTALHGEYLSPSLDALKMRVRRQALDAA